MSKINGLSGSQLRSMKRNLDPRAFTRAQAAALVASTTDPEVIDAMARHQNKHVRRYVFNKTGGFSEVKKILEGFNFLVFGSPLAVPAADPSITAQLEAWASSFGEDRSLVVQLFKEKACDLLAVKRSLISRKAARSKAAKKAAA